MKAINKLLLTIFSMSLLGGCTFNPSTPVNPGDDNKEGVPSEDPDDGVIEVEKILSIKICDGDNKSGKGEVLVGKKLYLTIDFVIKDNVELDLDKGEKDVLWTSMDDKVATVDQYGRVTGVKEGATTIVAETVLDHRKARFNLNVYKDNKNLHYEWQKIEGKDITPGDIIVLACPEEGVSATDENTGMYLHPVASSFSNDYSKITTLGSGSAQFIVSEGKKGGYTLENEEGQYLAVTNEKKVTFVNNKGNIDWTFEDYQQGICMESTSNINGWFMYNGPADKFSVYADDPSDKMFFVSIYRLTGVRD